MKTQTTQRLLAVALLLGLGPGIVGTAAATVAVGATPGSHQVTPSGAFTYTIPIAVPPGTAGIEPKLSLSYNSQGGNGLLGMGWSLGGLSVIHRCPKTVAQDGVLGGVNYNANDRYCLDGQRLVAINGTYGADSTEYRTESESYSRIVSYGSQGSGPAWWKVWTKSGQIIEYGNTADSRIEAQGKTEVMLWSLNKLADTVSNYLTVSYIEDNPNGQYYPDRIDYTGNDNAGKSPQNSVRFVYETRPDITPMYQAGSLMRNTVRLKNVQTYVGTINSRDYLLIFEESPSTQRSRLVSITECEGEQACLTPTLIGWQTTESNSTMWSAEVDYKLPDVLTVDGISDIGRRLIDLNGDGLPDLVAARYMSGGQTQFGAYLNTGSGWITAPNYKLPDVLTVDGISDIGRRLIDLNGDGLPDLVAARYMSGGQTQFGAYLNTGPRPDVIKSFTTGLGTTTTITYKPLTNDSVYTKDSSAVYPYVDIQAPMYVVSSVTVSDGTGGNSVTNYTYAGAKSRHQGGGFLGFRQVTAHDPQAHIRTTTTYRQDYPYHGQPLTSQKYTDAGVLLGQTLITYTDQLIDPSKSPVWRQSLPTRTVESSYELDGSPISSVTTDTQYDAWGNPTSIVVNSGGGYSKTTTNLYDNIVDPDRWFLGRLRRSTVNSVTP